MWVDNETIKDFLNFTGTADTVAEIIVQAKGKPISIGVSGQWGTGKSSMIKLIRQSLENHEASEKEFVFVEFNAWLYQGYDDARAALIEVIANSLIDKSKEKGLTSDQAEGLFEKAQWLRNVKFGRGAVAALKIPITEKIPPKAATTSKEETPPQEIDALRKFFQEALEELGITLVVLIDDLDRCLPETTISTLEAIRLFLFMDNTAFVVAADDKMIKHAVKKHFDGLDDDLVVNYFDKLIQIPIRVPALGTQEVRAYLMMLFVENSDLDDTQKQKIWQSVGLQLSQSWQGKRVDKSFIDTLSVPIPQKLSAELDMAERLAHIMTTSSQIAGNPRLIKRFLNALSIRMSISHEHGVGVDEAVLAKLLLFERCGPSLAYEQLRKSVNEDTKGRPIILNAWEQDIAAGKEPDLIDPWKEDFVKEWLTIPPYLGDKDLRGALYVSREHAPLITPDDKLSSTATELLAALLEQPDMANSLNSDLQALSHSELSLIMDRLLEQARQEQEWGAPAILNACLCVSRIHVAHASKLAGFIDNLPVTQIRASIVPKISSEPWAKDIFSNWQASKVAGPVKKAIQQIGEK